MVNPAQSSSLLLSTSSTCRGFGFAASHKSSCASKQVSPRSADHQWRHFKMLNDACYLNSSRSTDITIIIFNIQLDNNITVCKTIINCLFYKGSGLVQLYVQNSTVEARLLFFTKHALLFIQALTSRDRPSRYFAYTPIGISANNCTLVQNEKKSSFPQFFCGISFVRVEKSNIFANFNQNSKSCLIPKDDLINENCDVKSIVKQSL